MQSNSTDATDHTENSASGTTGTTAARFVVMRLVSGSATGSESESTAAEAFEALTGPEPYAVAAEIRRGLLRAFGLKPGNARATTLADDRGTAPRDYYLRQVGG